MSEIENPYLNNRKTWNEINGKEKANASMWRMFALLQIIVTALAVGGMIYASQLPDVVPMVFREDASGGVQLVGIPNRILKVDNGMIANQLAIFIEDLRQVPSSDDMRKRYVHQVKMMSTQTLFNKQLRPMLTDEYTSIGSGEQLVEIKTILPMGKNLWEVEWIETRDGAQTGRYKATIEYTRNQIPTKNSEELLWNFSGLMVTDINVHQVIGS